MLDSSTFREVSGRYHNQGIYQVDLVYVNILRHKGSGLSTDRLPEYKINSLEPASEPTSAPSQFKEAEVFESRADLHACSDIVSRNFNRPGAMFVAQVCYIV